MEGLIWVNNNLHSSSFLTGMAKFFSFLGDAGIIWLTLSCILLCFKKTRRGAIAMLISLAIGHFLNDNVLKVIFQRTRPFDANPAFREFLSSIDYAIPGGYSFPSGHTFSSFNCAVILMLYNKKMGYLTLPLASMIGLSRIYLCVHYPTDVLAGAIIGSLVALSVYCLDKFISKKIVSYKRGKIRGIK